MSWFGFPFEATGSFLGAERMKMLWNLWEFNARFGMEKNMLNLEKDDDSQRVSHSTLEHE